MAELYSFKRKAGFVVALITILLILGWLLINLIDVFLLVFAGLLLALFLSTLATWVASHTALSYRWAFAIVLLVIMVVLVGGGLLLAPVINTQIQALSDTLPQAVESFKSTVSRWPFGARLLEEAPTPADMLNRQSVFGRISGIFSLTFGLLTNIVIILFVGLYGALEPDLYRNGLIRLVPLAKRDRARDMLTKLGNALRQWLIGQILAMVTIGVATTLVMWFLGIPLALLLGLIAMTLTFIPNIGPIISAVPAVLLGLIESPTKALYVIGAYVIIQTIESYFVTPLIQRRMVELPPAVTITVQVALGVLWGITGLLVATPLMVAGIVLIQMIYVNDLLGDDMRVYGE